MSAMLSFVKKFWLIGLLFLGARAASAFSLLGPTAPWMTPELGYYAYGIVEPRVTPMYNPLPIGGPMAMGEGYRWNAPLITYGFDQNFLDFFGTNGVAAVEEAIAVFNDLPPASTLDPANFAASVIRVNTSAQQQSLIDLKSAALSIILEHMGLAQPIRFSHCLGRYADPTNYTLLIRNYDPVSLEPSEYVNGTRYTPVVRTFQFPGLTIADAEDLAVDTSPPLVSVADMLGTSPGKYFTGLTRDDAGGLRYLYGSNNVAMEGLLPNTVGAGTNSDSYVDRALRPGVEKIMFQRMAYIGLPDRFAPITNRYVDSYYTNGVLRRQTLERIVTQPDIFFIITTTGLDFYTRSWAGFWVNNGAPGHDGPGVIQPPNVVIFNRLGPYQQHFGLPEYATDSTSPQPLAWGTFDGSTNPPISYPTLSQTSPYRDTMLQFWLYSERKFPLEPVHYDFSLLSGVEGDVFNLQTSTNLIEWSTVMSMTNTGGIYGYFDSVHTNTARRYFRVAPEQ